MSGSQSPSLGEIVRTHRIRSGWSQEALSEASGVSVRTISDLERGHRAFTHLETARLLGAALGLTTPELQEFLAAARPVDREPDARNQPSTATSEPARWNASLPRSGSMLFGREAELALLAELIRPASGTIVTLTGPGGVGKTSLAIEAARLTAPAFADGVAFVDLAVVPRADEVPDAIAQVLGVPVAGGSAAERLPAVLGHRELVLVLDNAEHLIDTAPFIAALAAAAPRVQIVVTSRVRLRVSTEREVLVHPLDVADPQAPLEQLRASGAIQLFGERALAADRGFALSEETAPLVAELCRRLDGLPLAIELAASRLRMLSIRALLDRLDHRLPLLTGGFRDLPQRQQSMRDTIAWSYDLLRPSEQQLLRWLAVFAGGCSLPSAEALGRELGLSEPEALDAVANLVDNALVQRVSVPDGEPRFHLFETMREFGLEQLEATGELDDARRLHATHFLAYAELGAPLPDEPIHIPWLAAAFAERHNLVPAFDHLCRPETVELALRFAAAMGPYWWSKGPYAEGRPRLLRAIALAPAEPSAIEMHARFWTCFLLADAMDLSTALEIAHDGRGRATHIGSLRENAIALQALAWVEEHCEHWDVVRTLLNEALPQWIALDNAFMQAMCLSLMGGTAYADGDLTSAEHYEQRAGALFMDIGQPTWAAATYWYQGMIAADGGLPNQAAEQYDRCLRIWLTEPDALRRYKPLVGLADVAASLGEMERAVRLIGASDAFLRSVGMELMPTDTPAYERATAAARAALGDERYTTLTEAGSRLAPADWLAESSAILATARNYQQR